MESEGVIDDCLVNEICLKVSEMKGWDGFALITRLIILTSEKVSFVPFLPGPGMKARPHGCSLNPSQSIFCIHFKRQEPLAFWFGYPDDLRLLAALRPAVRTRCVALHFHFLICLEFSFNPPSQVKSFCSLARLDFGLNFFPTHAQ